MQTVPARGSPVSVLRSATRPPTCAHNWRRTGRRRLPTRTSEVSGARSPSSTVLSGGPTRRATPVHSRDFVRWRLFHIALPFVFWYYIIVPNAETNNQSMSVIDRIFNALDIESRGYILKQDLIQALLDRGVLLEDSRIRQTAQGLKKFKEKDKINATAFQELVSPHITLIEKALTGNLVIPDFKNFASFITNLYNRTLQNEEGKVSDYIPELGSVDAGTYALSVCTVDGQRFNIGNHSKKYLARSGANAINYCLAYADYDEQGIHQKIGRTPKEAGFDYLMLNSSGLPHNPLAPAGALMLSSMLAPGLKQEARFEKVKKIWQAASGGVSVSVNEGALESEKKVADSDRALAYYMQQKKLFP